MSSIIIQWPDILTLAEGYIHRTDLTVELGQFSQVAQQDVYNQVRHPFMVDRITLTDPFTLDNNFLELRSATYPVGALTRPLVPVSLDALARYTVTGDPCYYALEWTAGIASLAFAPTNVPASVTLEYYRNLDELNTIGNTTNDMLSRFPNLYLYSILWQAATYMQDLELIATYTGLYGRQIEIANAENAKLLYGAGVTIQAA